MWHRLTGDLVAALLSLGVGGRGLFRFRPKVRRERHGSADTTPQPSVVPGDARGACDRPDCSGVARGETSRGAFLFRTSRGNAMFGWLLRLWAIKKLWDMARGSNRRRPAPSR